MLLPCRRIGVCGGGANTHPPPMRFLLAALLATASALSYPALQRAPVTRASDAAVMPITSLWQEEDRAVVVFLRHFG